MIFIHDCVGSENMLLDSKKENKAIQIFKYVIPPVITAVLFCVVLAIKGIYPFGEDTIDYYDMAQQISAFYYHVYDVLHGTKAVFFDWYTGLSVNMAMSTSGCSNLSIFNLFFLFIKRDRLLQSLSIFQMIKMMCMTLTMYIYLHKAHVINYFYETVFSVGYGFCGFVLLLYITNQWMDVAVLFPLMMLYVQELLRKGKCFKYIIVLSLAMINSYYITFMMLIYIILMTGWILLSDKIFDKKMSLEDNSNKRRYYLLRLLLSTLASIAVSCFIFLPQIKQTLTSARFENENGGGLFNQYLSIISKVEGAYTTRYFSLLGLSFIAALLAYYLIRCRIEKKLNNKEIFVLVGSIIIIVAELFFESINLIWHFGSYVQYPIRNGFMIYFTMAACVAYVIEKYNKNDIVAEAETDVSKTSKRSLKKSAYIFTGITFIAGIAILCFGIPAYFNNPGMAVRKVFHITALIMIALFVIYVILIVVSEKRRSLPVYAAPLIACELIFYGILLFGKPTFVTGYSEEPEQEGEYVRICNQLAESFDITPDAINRIKNPDESLNSNYGLVLRRGELSNWTHLISPDLQQGAAKWGYTIQFTRMLDAGGTVFSDALIGIKNIISYLEQSEDLYEKIYTAEAVIDHKTGEKAEYGYYRSKYTLPFGIVLYPPDHDLMEESPDMVKLHNDVYQGIMESDENIASWIYGDNGKNKALVKDDVERLGSLEEEFTDDIEDVFHIEGYKALYFVANSVDEQYYNYKIKVNGKDIIVPSIKEPDNQGYPAHFNNNAVYIGSFRDEDVNLGLNIEFNTEYNNYEFDICAIDLDMLEEMCSSYEDSAPEIHMVNNGVDMRVSASEQQIMIIPLAYDDSFEVMVNGVKVNAYRYAGLFTAVPLLDGKNEVSLRFIPSGMKTGAIISALAALMLVFVFIKEIKGKSLINEETEKATDYILYGICLAGFLFMFTVMYIVPVIAGPIMMLFQ